MFILQNYISTEDDLIDYGQGEEYQYWSYRKIIYQSRPRVDGPLMIMPMILDQQVKVLERRVFNLLDLIGAMGGVLELFVYLFGFVFYGISKHQATMMILRRLFLARTRDDKLFAQSHTHDHVGNVEKTQLDDSIRHEVKSHRNIKLTQINHLKLYVMKNFCFCLKATKNHKLFKLYSEGHNMIIHELNVVKIIKSLKQLRILAASKFIDKDTKFLIAHNQ